MRRLKSVPDLLRTFGWRGLARRGLYVAGTRSGWFERLQPVSSITASEPDLTWPYRFDLKRIRRLYDTLPEITSIRATVEAQVTALLEGQMLYFSGEHVNIGWPPRWLENPSTLSVYDANLHWSRIPDFDPIMGDIKYTWEPSRFSFVYLLARAFVLSGNDRYPEAFWQALEDWAAKNPINGGPNWRCGQETSLRAMSVLFGLLTFADHLSTTAARLQLASSLLHASGKRVEPTIGYALSQRNNHALSEAVGLWTLAALFTDWPEAASWRRTAETALREVLEDQFYPDGAYAQQSFNYQRLAMHNLMWLMRISSLTDTPTPSGVCEALERCACFLYALQDDSSGWLPNYGANDGALILPLSSADYRDYRPTLQAASLMTTGQPLYTAAPHDEEAIWLAPDALENRSHEVIPARESLTASISGHYTSRGPSSFAFWRTAQYRHRPAQADNLHLDIWFDGVNLALDPGTYSYNKPVPWDNALARTRVHNTGNADGLDQMTRAGRFLWLDWNDAVVIDHVQHDVSDLWLLETRLIPKAHGSSRHRRAILRSGDAYAIADALKAETAQHIGIHWNLAPLDWTPTQTTNNLCLSSPNFIVTVQCLQPASITIGLGEDKTRLTGWQSRYYGVLEPCLAVDAVVAGKHAQFISCFGRPGQEPSPNQSESLLAYLEAPEVQRASLAQTIIERQP
jgi:hypothetical protein